MFHLKIASCLVDLIKLKQSHLHNFPSWTICEFLMCPRMSPLEKKDRTNSGEHNKGIIIMVFKVSFVININLFTRLRSPDKQLWTLPFWDLHSEICVVRDGFRISESYCLDIRRICYLLQPFFNQFLSVSLTSQLSTGKPHKSHAQMMYYNTQRKKSFLIVFAMMEASELPLRMPQFKLLFITSGKVFWLIRLF